MTVRCMYGACKDKVTRKICNQRGGIVGYLCDSHALQTWAATPHPGLNVKILDLGGDANAKPASANPKPDSQRGVESDRHPAQTNPPTGVADGGPDLDLGGGEFPEDEEIGLAIAAGFHPPVPVPAEPIRPLVPSPGKYTPGDPFAIASALARSGYFSDIRDASQAVVKILAGQELGIGPIASMQGIFIVQGRPAFSANLVAAVIQKSQHFRYHVDHLNEERCILSFYEDGELLGKSEFSMEDAKRAGLLAGKNAHSWRQYPRNMLFARALTNGARWHCPAVFGGNSAYTPEELDDPVVPNKPGREPDPELDGEYAKTRDFAQDARDHIEGMR